MLAIPAGFEHITRQQEPLAPYTWFRLGGAAALFAEPTSVKELTALVKACAANKIPVKILGEGSNVLVRDEGFNGLVIRLTSAEFGKVSTSGNRIICGGGAKLGHVISASVREGLAGLEELVGIPGTIGGALRTNAATHGGDIGQHVVSATVLTRSGEVQTKTQAELRFGYRDSSLDELVILEAVLELDPGNAASLTKQMQQAWILKRASEPSGEQGMGSIFKSPAGFSAKTLIEECELKGMRQGDAEISQKHANFIVTGPKAKSRDVLMLIDAVRKTVAERTSVILETAIEVW